MSETKNLGIVKALHIGLTAPANHALLWYDTNSGINRLKYYSLTSSSWELLIGISVAEMEEAISDAFSLFTWKSAVISRVDSLPGTPSEGDRYLLTAGDNDKDIAEYIDGEWVYTTPTDSCAVCVIDEPDCVYLFTSGAWVAKYFELTTASNGVKVVGRDVQWDVPAIQKLAIIDTEEVIIKDSEQPTAEAWITKYKTLPLSAIKNSIIYDNMVYADSRLDDNTTSPAGQWGVEAGITLTKLSDSAGSYVKISKTTGTNVGMYLAGILTNEMVGEYISVEIEYDGSASTIGLGINTKDSGTYPTSVVELTPDGGVGDTGTWKKCSVVTKSLLVPNILDINLLYVFLIPSGTQEVLVKNIKVYRDSQSLSERITDTGIHVISGTYAAILALTGDAGLLKRGYYYEITDFCTINDQLDYDASGVLKPVLTTRTGAVESLILFAVSGALFHTRVYSPTRPTDILEYDITYSVTDYMSVPAKGKITYRKDTVNNNSAYFDFREIKFLRYESSTGSGIFNQWKDNGEEVLESDPITGTSINIGYGSYDIVVKGTRLIFGKSNSKFYIDSLAEDIEIGDNNSDFIVGNQFKKIKISSNNSAFTIGNNVSNIEIRSKLNTNIILPDNFSRHIFEAVVTNQDFTASLLSESYGTKIIVNDNGFAGGSLRIIYVDATASLCVSDLLGVTVASHYNTSNNVVINNHFLNESRGTNIAITDNDILLTSTGNTFSITGTDPIHSMTVNTVHVSGYNFQLIFSENTKIFNNAIGSAYPTLPILTAGGVDLIIKAGTTLYFNFDANAGAIRQIGIEQFWEDSTEGTLTIDNGLLYNWYAVNTGKLAPTGWLVASYDDWSTLVAYIGGENCGYKLKARGAIWGSVNSGATDEFNFSAVGAGFRILPGTFFFQRVLTRFWTSTLEIEGGIPYYFDLEDLTLDITSEVGVEGTGHSVRCVRTASTDELLLADGTYCEEVVDASGNSYRTVKIGTQVWMAENLKTTKYNDDTDIPNITNNALWEAAMAGAYCSYRNDVITVYVYESPLTIKPTKGRYIDIDRILETTNKRFTSDVELAGISAISPSKVWYVDATNGDDTFGVTSHWFKTIEAAVTQASSGDTVIIMPGTHTVTTTATNGIGKEGLKYYAHAGAIINKATNGDVFNTSGMTGGFDVFGHGIFNKTAGTGGVFVNAITTRIFKFEASEVYSNNHCFTTHNLHAKVTYAEAVGHVVNYGNNLVFEFDEFKSTNSEVVYGGGDITNMKLSGNKVTSVTGMAISHIYSNTYTYAEIDVNQITGVGDNVVNLDCIGTVGTKNRIILNCNYATSVYARDCYLTGTFYTDKLTNISARIDANVTTKALISSGGTTKVSILDGTNGYNGVQLTVSGGNVEVTKVTVQAGLGYNITGGTVTLKDDIYYSRTYPTTRLVNGGELILDYETSFIPSYVVLYVYYSICKLQSGIVRLKGKIATGTIYSLIEWYGGKLIIENAILTSTQSNCVPIRATQPNLELKVIGNYATNITSLGGVLAGKYYTEKYAVSAVATTSMYINESPYFTIEEADAVTYDTKAKLAERMAYLISNDARVIALNLTATQDNAGVDEYFYIVGTTYARQATNMWSLVNLVKTVIHYESYPMTEILGGEIIEDVNIE